MYGIRAGPLVMATMAVILALYGVLFVGQGRLSLGALVLLAAAACASYVVRVYTRAAAERRRGPASARSSTRFVGADSLLVPPQIGHVVWNAVELLWLPFDVP